MSVDNRSSGPSNNWSALLAQPLLATNEWNPKTDDDHRFLFLRTYKFLYFSFEKKKWFQHVITSLYDKTAVTSRFL